MFSLLKSAFKSKDLRKRLLFTVLVLVIFRIGTFITVPYVDAKAIQLFAKTGLFGVLNTFSGGALTRYSIFSMGVSPYITASIIVQLLQMDIIPAFVEWSKQGEVGRRKLSQFTRYITIFIAFLQAIGISFSFNAMANFGLITVNTVEAYLMIALVLTAGTMFVTWLGDMITEHGFGNGVSIIIFAGIVSRIPDDLYTFYVNTIQGKTGEEWIRSIIFSVAVAVAIVLIIIAVIYMEQAERRLPVGHSKSAGSNQLSRLPLKINSAGVIPVIFASSLVTVPSTILGFFTQYSSEGWYQFIVQLTDMTQPIGAAFYTVMIILFTYFYAFVQVNPEKVAENLQRQGGYILSVRPGQETEKYISYLLIRLSTLGAFYLGVVALLPLAGSSLWQLPQGLMFGGTSLLIVIGVALELSRQIEGKTTTRRYQGFIEE